MSLFNDFEDGKVDPAVGNDTHNSEQQQVKSANAQAEAPVEQPPINEYRVRSGPAQTTSGGFGQGYPQTPQSSYQPVNQGGYVPYNPNQGYQTGNYPPVQDQRVYRPNQYQYQSGGWQQPLPQQPAARTQENYQWNFQEYEKAAEKKPKKKKSRGLVVFAVSLICLFSVGLIGLSAYGVFNYISDKQSVTGSESVAVAEDADTSGAGIEIASRPQVAEPTSVSGKMTIPQVAKAVLPSVVGVIQYQPEINLQETGAGSGIVMSEDGYIVTNAHVVAGGEAFKVVLADGTPKDAELIGADSITDLAVLKIVGLDGDILTPATFGDSTKIEVGEQVIAIGNPAGTELAGSVTQGIISAVNREIPQVINMPLIQTDAAINPGNSGGALVNEYGQVIGINSSKIVAEGFEGIGFAIPISEAKPIIDELVTNGRVTGRVKLGISAREIDEIDARKAGLKEGIRIEAIDPQSDLIAKGVQKFDIITDVEGERVLTLNDLKKILERYKPGDLINLTLFRQIGVTRSETIEVQIRLMED